MKKKEIMIIEWEDSGLVTNQWEYFEDLQKMEIVKCITCGVIIEKNEKVIRVAGTFDKGVTQSPWVIDIPRRSILKIRRIN